MAIDNAQRPITNMADAKQLRRNLQGESKDALIERLLTLQALADARAERIALLEAAQAAAPQAKPAPASVASDPAEPYLRRIAELHKPRACDLASVRQALNGKPGREPNRATFRRLKALAQSHGYANTTADPDICAWLAEEVQPGVTRYTDLMVTALPDSEQPGFQRLSPGQYHEGQHGNVGAALAAAYAKLG